MSQPPISLIIGLGNPGDQYRGTRHNAGADFVAELACLAGVTLAPESRFFGVTGRCSFAGHDLRLLIPTTYMNRSGQAVASMARFYRIPTNGLLIAHDELDIAPGTARFKLGGGHGGHNGLRSIVPALGNESDYYRLRIGIGHPGHSSQVSGYVLSRPSPDDRAAIDAAVDEALRALPLLLDGDMTKAMTRLHSFRAGNEGES